ncbi:hypothetical protein J2S43_002576 [Catenuloplanes nepalensis]|uniref:PE domain-containing protein n=1 Tax=Catenuloplanes nepalensis TaxID=587533 RepID=A0ABT9MRK8_9ACTN|nr:hypothetical protein [Catenuloplanes nepalensis]MDP9794064.1 hypothetical protein [Catenuloplanes nepalensis]
MSTHGYRVDPGALESYAALLAAARDAVRHPAERLAALDAEPIVPGAFAEAQALAEQHAAMVTALAGLTTAVAAALGFAGEVTGTIAAGYRETDRAVADTYLGAV